MNNCMIRFQRNQVPYGYSLVLTARLRNRLDLTCRINLSLGMADNMNQTIANLDNGPFSISIRNFARGGVGVGWGAFESSILNASVVGGALRSLDSR